MSSSQIQVNNTVWDRERDERGVVVEICNNHAMVRMIDGPCSDGYVLYRKGSFGLLEIIDETE